jgi:hypothetical protein
MLEFHMLVVAVVIFNILELITKIVPNYPTILLSVKLKKEKEKRSCQIADELFVDPVLEEAYAHIKMVQTH